MDHMIQEAELIPKRTSKQRFRKSIFEAWGSRCAYCGAPADTLDHVIPRMYGGLTVRENLVPACRGCNGRKGSTGVWTWWTQQAYWDFPRALRVFAWISGKLSAKREAEDWLA